MTSLLTGLNSSYIYVLKKQLTLEFHIYDLLPLKYFFGLKIHFSTDEFFVNQAKYLIDLLHTSVISYNKLCSKPISTSINLYTTALTFNDPSVYRQLMICYSTLLLFAPILPSL